MKQFEILRADNLFRNGYGFIPKHVMHDQELSLESKAIYSYLCALSGNDRCTFPYRETILRQLGISKNTYYKHYKPLIEEGYVSVSRTADKSAPNTYTLTNNPALKSQGYGRIPRAVMTDQRLSVKAKGLYAYLCSYCGAGNHAFPKLRDIVFHLGISEPTYYKCYNQLIELGYIASVQRKSGARFGVNDYYLTGIPAAEKPKPKKSPPPKIRDTKIRDTISRDIKNCDVYTNNKSFTNKISKINPSTNLPKTPQIIRPDIRDGLTGIFNILQKEHTLEPALFVSEEQQETLLSQFQAHMGDKLHSRSIRNVSAYMKTSLLNWLRDRHLRRGISPPKTPDTKPSYDMSAIKQLVNMGIF